MLIYIKELFTLEVVFRLLLILVNEKYKAMAEAVFRLVIVIFIISIMVRLKDMNWEDVLNLVLGE